MIQLNFTIKTTERGVEVNRSSPPSDSTSPQEIALACHIKQVLDAEVERISRSNGGIALYSRRDVSGQAKSINEEWTSLKQAAYMKMSPEAQLQLQKAFFAGALGMFHALDRISQESGDDENKQAAYVQVLLDELRCFQKSNQPT